jgi:hypothetical protein
MKKLSLLTMVVPLLFASNGTNNVTTFTEPTTNTISFEQLTQITENSFVAYPPLVVSTEHSGHFLIVQEGGKDLFRVKTDGTIWCRDADAKNRLKKIVENFRNSLEDL